MLVRLRVGVHWCSVYICGYRVGSTLASAAFGSASPFFFGGGFLGPSPAAAAPAAAFSFSRIISVLRRLGDSFKQRTPPLFMISDGGSGFGHLEFFVSCWRFRGSDLEFVTRPVVADEEQRLALVEAHVSEFALSHHLLVAHGLVFVLG